jgi:hypothetical protein
VKSVLSRYDRTVFSRNPFTNAALLNVPRREIEYTLVKACCVNPHAFRLVRALGFKRKCLEHENPRRVWGWLITPVPLRNKQFSQRVARSIDQMQRDLHDGLDDYNEAELFEIETGTALAAAIHLMLLYGATEVIQRERRRRLHAVAAQRVKAKLPKLRAMIDTDPEAVKTIATSMVELMLRNCAIASRQAVEKGAYQ